jgi:translation initiation factor 1 (eIF-1/SUI1)
VRCLADAFADAAQQEEDNSGVDYVHIRIQQRNGKKSLTTVQVGSSPHGAHEVL